MRRSEDILDPAHRSVFDELARKKVLLGFDYDGTLAPIADRPELAAPRPSTWTLFGKLCSLYPCLVVTGRGRGDLLDRFRDLPLAALIGNHGIEWDPPNEKMEDCRNHVADWVEFLTRELSALPDVRLENKTYSLSLHYRGAVEPERTARLARAAALRCQGVRIVGGKCVFNLVPEGAPDKGEALEKVLSMRGCETVFFIGDDINDEPAFEKVNALGGISVRVGAEGVSAARYRLINPARIDELLILFLERRQTIQR
jgi:trehalose 6-phosphate phosphatase